MGRGPSEKCGFTTLEYEKFYSVKLTDGINDITIVKSPLKH